MWTVSVGSQGGVSTALRNQSLAILDQALSIWSRYLDFGSASLSVELNFVSLPEGILAEGGTEFFSIGSNLFQATTILELQDGVDRNGAEADIFINIDTNTLNAGEFYFGGDDAPDLPSGQFDLLSTLAHEVGHGLGFLSLSGIAETSVFDSFIGPSTAGPGQYFKGPNAVAANGGDIRLDTDPNHVANTSTFFLMGPVAVDGFRYFLNPVELAILQDIGVPILTPTNGDDILYGFEPTSDTVDLLAGADYYDGQGGEDTIYGGAGGDTLKGGGGFDSIDGGSGGDLIDGGEGRDNLSYLTATSGVAFDISTSLGSAGYAAGDLFINFERYWASNYEDTVAGGADYQFAFLEAGDDLFHILPDPQQPFADNFEPTIFGGDGNDTLSAARSDVAVRIIAPNSVFDGEVRFRESGFINFEFIEFENFEGSRFDDSIEGSESNNLIKGAAGDDTLWGGGGSDTLDGGDGVDIVVLKNENPSEPVNFNLFAEQVGGDQFFNVEQFISYGRGDDTLIGDNDANYLGIAEQGENIIKGLGGDDTLVALQNTSSLRNTFIGGDGDDYIDAGGTFYGDPGADTLIGGDEGAFLYAMLNYSLSDADIAINLSDGTASGGYAEGDILIRIDSITGTNFDDYIKGSSRPNGLLGGAGDDTLDGAENADIINGGTGDDLIFGGTGDDSIAGGAGNDVISFQPGDGDDLLLGFSPGGDDDAIELIGFGEDFDTFQEIMSIAQTVGTSVRLDFGELLPGIAGSNIIELRDVAIDDLTPDDFIFS
ncbi:MAG: hypothetical protein AAGB02_01665 [Pseudomonadota bacterium]